VPTSKTSLKANAIITHTTAVYLITFAIFVRYRHWIKSVIEILKNFRFQKNNVYTQQLFVSGVLSLHCSPIYRNNI